MRLFYGLGKHLSSGKHIPLLVYLCWIWQQRTPFLAFSLEVRGEFLKKHEKCDSEIPLSWFTKHTTITHRGPFAQTSLGHPLAEFLCSKYGLFIWVIRSWSQWLEWRDFLLHSFPHSYFFPPFSAIQHYQRSLCALSGLSSVSDLQQELPHLPRLLQWWPALSECGSFLDCCLLWNPDDSTEPVMYETKSNATTSISPSETRSCYNPTLLKSWIISAWSFAK